MSLQDTMRRQDRVHTGLALGGLGTGSMELRKDGCFYNWTLFNNRPQFTGPVLPFTETALLFFAVRFQERGQPPRMKLLQIDPGQQGTTIESPLYVFPWMNGVDRIEYEASFPFAWLKYTDAQMPFDVELEAFSPFIPPDVKNSALPAIFFQFKLTAKTSRPVDVMLLASLRNCVGYDLKDKVYATRIDKDKDCRLLEMACTGMDKAHGSWGTQTLASLSGDSTHYAGWEHQHPYYEIVVRNTKLPDVDDTAGRNITDKTTGQVRAMERLWSTVARSTTLRRRGQKFEHTFLTGWHFPNLYANPDVQIRTHGKMIERRLEGHYYATLFKSAADVAHYAIENRQALTERTRAFHSDFFDSTVPKFVLDQINSHLNTYATSSWLTKDFNFGIIEGRLDRDRRGPLSSVDVSQYGSVMTAALFPDLDRSTMRAYMRLQNPKTGSISHGIDLDFTSHDAREAVTKRLDLPSQYVIQALRAYFWSGDKAYLAAVWPSIKNALEYVLRERDANGDLLPDMEGIMCTYDNFAMFGASSFISSLWLAALTYAADAAGAAGDPDAAQRYREIVAKARPVFEEKLWAGSYYRLWNDAGGKHGGQDEGCLTDQLIGQWALHWIGATPPPGPLPAGGEGGGVFHPQRVRAALQTILKMAYRPDYGLLNCRWPNDGYLHDVDKDCWCDQANLCWTGVELAFASFLIYEGLVRDGLKVIKNVDDRYRKAGLYFDHHEFGGHYYRAMAAWDVVHALLGLSVREGRYEFAPRLPDGDQKIFFTANGAALHYERQVAAKKEIITLAVRAGNFRCRELVFALKRKGAARVKVTVREARAANGKAARGTPLTLNFAADVGPETVVIGFDKELIVNAGGQVRVEIS